MTDYAIILMVTAISFVICAILAFVVYSIDKNADHRDSRK